MADNIGIGLSLGGEGTIRGYTIKRMPLGAYIKALDKLGKLPGELLAACFPGQSLTEAAKAVTNADGNTLQPLVTRALTIAPEYIITLAAQLLDIPEATLLEDPLIGLDGLAEMLEAWFELNGLMVFLKTARALAMRVRSMKGQGAGSNG